MGSAIGKHRTSSSCSLAMAGSRGKMCIRDSYKDCARRMQLDSIAPEASIMDIDLVDPYNTLLLSICY